MDTVADSDNEGSGEPETLGDGDVEVTPHPAPAQMPEISTITSPAASERRKGKKKRSGIKRIGGVGDAR